MGDGRSEPITIGGLSGNSTLYFAHTDLLQVTATITTSAITVSPCLLRQDYSTSISGISYRLIIAGAGTANAGSATNAATAAGPVAGTNNVLRFASGGTNYAVGDVVIDTTTPGAIPANTVVIANSATTVTLSNFVVGSGVASGDSISYAGITSSPSNLNVATGGCSATFANSPQTTLSGAPINLLVEPTLGSAGTSATLADANTHDLMFYGSGGSITAGSSTLSVPAPAFYPLRDATYGTSLYDAPGTRKTTIVIHDTTGACADFVTQIISSTAGTVGATGIGTPSTATLAAPYSCPGGSGISASNTTELIWGTVVASPTDTSNLTIHAGQSVEVQGAGSGSTYAAPVPLESSVSSVSDYLSATLANNFAASPISPLPVVLRWGSSDTAAVEAAAALVSSAANPGYRGLYWPAGINTFMAGVTTTYSSALDPLFQVTRCGEGRVIWPLAGQWTVGPYNCTAGVPSLPPKTLFASQSLKQARAQVAAAGVPTFGLIGDSWITPANNDAGGANSIAGDIAEAIRSINSATGANVFQWGIGGTTVGQLDPLGVNYGYGPGLIGMACSSRPPFFQSTATKSTSGATAAGSATLSFASPNGSTFYPGESLTDTTTSGAIPAGTYVKSVTATTVLMSANATGSGVANGDSITGNMCNTPWLTILEYAQPAIDAIAMRSGDNDGASFPIGGLEDIIQQTQAPAWNSVAGRYPDFVLIPGSNPFYGNFLIPQIFTVAGLERSMARSGFLNQYMHNGGSVGMVDADRWTHLAEDGFDVGDTTPAAFVMEPVPPGPSNSINQGISTPFTFQEPGSGWELSAGFRQSGAGLSQATWFGNLGGGINLQVGNGSTFTPAIAGTQTGAATTGYPGGAFVLGCCTAGGHVTVTRYLYRFVGTCSAGTFTAQAGGSVLACNTPIANAGHSNASVWVCGTGIGSSTPPTWLSASLTNCVNGTLKPGSGSGNGVSTNGQTLTLTANIGTTVSAEAITVGIYEAMPGDPTDAGCALGNLTTLGANTQDSFAFYISPEGQVGFSESGTFESQGQGCQWFGAMAGFFGTKYNLTVGTEDGATHSSLLYLSNNSVSRPTVLRSVPDDARITPWLTTSESWGLQTGGNSGGTGYFGPFGGGGSAHPGGMGAKQLYGPLWRAQDWNAAQ